MIRKALPVLAASAIAFYSGVSNHQAFDSYFSTKKYNDAPKLELIYSKNDLGKTDIILVNQSNAKRYPVAWGENGLRVGSLEYRMKCITEETNNKDVAIQYAKPLIENSRQIRKNVHKAVLGSRFAEDNYFQDFLDIDIIYRINENRNVETYITDGKEAYPLTRNMQMGNLDYRMKGIVSEATAGNGLLYNVMKEDLLKWLDASFRSPNMGQQESQQIPQQNQDNNIANIIGDANAIKNTKTNGGDSLAKEHN